MLTASVNLWTAPADVRCITTNGYVRRDGACVMGRGCAKEAADLDPRVPFDLGAAIRRGGNVVHVIRERPGKPALVSFPVKHRWDQDADLDLIVRSAHQLVALVERKGWTRVLVPRPGCGNGRLSWSDVSPRLAEVFDDRFTVVHVPARRR